MTVEGTSKNRIISPGKVLHFYNSPPDSTVDSLNEVFAKVGVTPPNGVKFFSQGKRKGRGPVGYCDKVEDLSKTDPLNMGTFPYETAQEDPLPSEKNETSKKQTAPPQQIRCPLFGGSTMHTHV